MGNSQDLKLELPKYDWTWVGNHNGLDLYRRQSDGLISEKRRIVLDHRFTFQNQQQIYKLRENNNLGFVKVYQVDGVDETKAQDKVNFCKCAESTKLNVYSERIEHRLSELPQLTFPESLHILWETTNSFQQIYERFGPFHINGELIGINSEKKVKVWVNENFASNHPSHEIPYLKTMTSYDLPPELRNEHQMITNLLQVIEEKTERGRFPRAFGEGAYNSSKSFHELKRYLNNFMQIQYRDYVPEIIQRSTVLASQQQISNYGAVQPHSQLVQSIPRPQAHFISNPSEPIRATQNSIKQSFIQTTYHPVEQGPIHQVDRVNSSVVPPQQNSEPFHPLASQRPTVVFGNTRAVEVNPLNLGQYNSSLPTQSYNATSAPTPFISSSSNLQGNSQFPKFQLLNEPATSANGGQISFKTAATEPPPASTYYRPQPVSEGQRPEAQLQRIREMLRQDIGGMGQGGQYQKGEGASQSNQSV